MPWVNKQRLHELETYEMTMLFLLNSDEEARSRYIKDFDELQRMAKENMNARTLEERVREGV